MTKSESTWGQKLAISLKEKIFPAIALVMLANVVCFAARILADLLRNHYADFAYGLFRLVLFFLLGGYISKRETPPESSVKRSLGDTLSSFFMPGLLLFVLLAWFYSTRNEFGYQLMSWIESRINADFSNFYPSLQTPALLFLYASFLEELPIYAYMLTFLSYQWRKARFVDAKDHRDHRDVPRGI